MYPQIGEGWWALPTYFLMGLIGFIASTWLLRRDAPRLQLDPVRVVDLCIILIIAGVAGARLFHVLFDGMLGDYIDLCFDPDALGASLPGGLPCTSDAACLDAQNRGLDIGAICRLQTGMCVPEQDCLRPLAVWAGGLTWYGGLIGAIIAAWITTRRWKWPFLRISDLAAPGVALGLAFGRIGCFLSGCCFGEVCELPWGVRFPGGSTAFRLHKEQDLAALIAQHNTLGEWLSLPVHPTQLYEAASGFLIFGLLWFVVRTRKRFEGEVLAWLLILYGVVRFTLEYWRADQRGGAWIFSTSQWISMPLILGGIGLLVWGLRSGARSLDGSNTEEEPDSAPPPPAA